MMNFAASAEPFVAGPVVRFGVLCGRTPQTHISFTCWQGDCRSFALRHVYVVTCLQSSLSPRDVVANYEVRCFGKLLHCVWPDRLSVLRRCVTGHLRHTFLSRVCRVIAGHLVSDTCLLSRVCRAIAGHWVADTYLLPCV